MKFNCKAISHIGRIRENNEDNLYINGKYREEINKNITEICDEGQSKAVFAVFDGMGGENFGEIASLRAAEELMEHDWDSIELNPQRYIVAANKKICDEIEKNEGRQIGTTVALLVIDGNNAIICNLGDSRIYRLNNNQFEQLSRDHTRAQQMVDIGVLTTDEVRNHPLKHMLTQHLGVDPDEFILEPYICNNIAVCHGDMFLLCSDGLTDMLSDDEIRKILQEKTDMNALAEKLVKQALAAGGKDNVTVVVINIQ